MDVPQWVRQATGPLAEFLAEVYRGGQDGVLTTRNRVFRWRKRLSARGIDLSQVVEWQQERVVHLYGSSLCPREVEALAMRVKWRGLADASSPTTATGEPAVQRPGAEADRPRCPVVLLPALRRHAG